MHAIEFSLPNLDWDIKPVCQTIHCHGISLHGWFAERYACVVGEWGQGSRGVCRWLDTAIALSQFCRYSYDGVGVVIPRLHLFYYLVVPCHRLSPGRRFTEYCHYIAPIYSVLEIIQTYFQTWRYRTTSPRGRRGILKISFAVRIRHRQFHIRLGWRLKIGVFRGTMFDVTRDRSIGPTVPTRPSAISSMRETKTVFQLYTISVTVA